MTRRLLTTVMLATTLSMGAVAAEPALTFTKVWTHHHGTAEETPGQLSEIPAFDPRTNTIWVVGIVGVDVLNADTGARVGHIDVTGYGFVNSVAIHNGVAALAVEAGPSPAPGRARPGRVLFYDTKTRSLSDGVNELMVGALPDMLTFTHDGTKLLVANEATPNTYGARIGTSVPRVYDSAAGDPTGSVTIIDMETRTVMANEGDFREDDGDRSAASSLGAVAPLNNLRVSNTDSSPGNLFAAGARSFTIRHKTGNLVYDSGDILDKKAAELGIYDDGRSRDKGVEPEGITLLDMGGRTYALVGLERTLTSAVRFLTSPTQRR